MGIQYIISEILQRLQHYFVYLNDKLLEAHCIYLVERFQVIIMVCVMRHINVIKFLQNVNRLLRYYLSNDMLSKMFAIIIIETR